MDDQAEALHDPVLRQIFLDYDRAFDLNPDDPAVDALASRMAEATRRRYGADELPGPPADSEVPALIQAAVNEASPAWSRIDVLVRDRLRNLDGRGPG